jgi:hypothetical protein
VVFCRNVRTSVGISIVLSEYSDLCRNIGSSVGISGLLSSESLFGIITFAYLFFPHTLPYAVFFIFSPFTLDLWRMYQEKINEINKKIPVQRQQAGFGASPPGKPAQQAEPPDQQRPRYAATPWRSRRCWRGGSEDFQASLLQIFMRLKRRIRGFSGKPFANLYAAEEEDKRIFRQAFCKSLCGWRGGSEDFQASFLQIFLRLKRRIRGFSGKLFANLYAAEEEDQRIFRQAFCKSLCGWRGGSEDF